MKRFNYNSSCHNKYNIEFITFCFFLGLFELLILLLFFNHAFINSKLKIIKIKLLMN